RRGFGARLLGDPSGSPVPEEDLPTQRALRGDTVIGRALRYRTAPEAEERMILVSASPVVEDGEVRLVITIYHDLTERIRLENQLKAQLEELKQVDRLKSEFLSVVTHELRTPLTSIKGYAEFLEDEIGGPLTPEQGDFVRQLQFSAGQLETLVDDLLDLARLEAGRFTLRLAPVDAAAIVRQVAETFQPQAKEERLALVVKAPDRPVPIQADARRLIQVLNNLMSNALKFTPAGGNVCLSLIEARDEIHFEVTDTGIGVAPEHQGKLFTKFFQVDGALNRAYKGTGLGLPITKGLVEAHGGRVEVASAPGEGTTFTVVLPRGRGEAVSPEAIEAE
ncbi:MAG: sensor histidine kinase, partial [Candidatus Sericytochromatia bacterium]